MAEEGECLEAKEKDAWEERERDHLEVIRKQKQLGTHTRLNNSHDSHQ